MTILSNQSCGFFIWVIANCDLRIAAYISRKGVWRWTYFDNKSVTVETDRYAPLWIHLSCLNVNVIGGAKAKIAHAWHANAWASYVAGGMFFLFQVCEETSKFLATNICVGILTDQCRERSTCHIHIHTCIRRVGSTKVCLQAFQIVVTFAYCVYAVLPLYNDELIAGVVRCTNGPVWYAK